MAAPRNHTYFLLSICIIFSFLLIPEKGRANPTGGNVVAGSATLSGVGSNSLQVNQSSNAAIINWKTFSINNGQSTSFIQPSRQSAVLNRVLGGSTSRINGTLTANGQVFLLNQDGVIIGRTGVVNASGGFTASTQNMTDSNFLKGKLRFSGHSTSGVTNLGEVTSSLGNVVLIGNSVTNSGSIKAGTGTVGLVAGNNVLLAQKNLDGSTITVSPSSLETTTNKTGVLNSGTINAAAAELKAADGNIYAVAIENSGAVRATTVKHQGGHIWLSADSGAISNSGTLDASATAAGGRGGRIILKSPGTVSHTGTILAKGGMGGVGGNVDILSGSLVFKGAVDLTSPLGKFGTLVLDPSTLNVISGGGSDFTQNTIDPIAVDAALNSANLTLNADNLITVSNEITWTSGSTLTLSTNNSGASIAVNAPIIGVNGGLTINTAGAIVPSTKGSVNVGAFILQNGFWNQNAGGGTLAGFTANSDFELQNSSTFFRVEAGDGSGGNPYQIVDVYGLQGIASPSNSLLASNFIQTQNINASNTATWNPVGGGSYVGFIPIGNSSNFFTGNYNGQNYTITGLTINQPSANFMGLFGYTGNAITLQGINLVGSSVNGYTYVGGLAGYAGTNNTVQNCSFTGTVSGTYEVGGLLGASNATVASCYSGGTVNGGLGEQAGGLIGQNLYNVNGSYSTATVSGSYNNGGLVGENEGTIQNCYATGGTYGAYSTGGLVGENDNGTIEACYSTGLVSGNSNIGGLVGQNDSFIFNSYATGTVSGAAPFSVYLGGLVGVNNNLVQNCYSTGEVSGTLGVGGLVGYNSNTITACYWANDVGSNGSLSTAAYNTYGTIDSYTRGVPLASMKLQSTFAPAGTGVGQWDFTNTWTTGGDTTTPLLRSLSFNLSGSTAAGDTVDLIANGALLQSQTATGGNYSFLVPADVLNGALVTDVSSNTSNTFYNGGFIPASGTSVTGVNLLANTLTIQGVGLSSNTQLGTATGALAAGTDGINFTVDTNHNLSTISGIAISIQSPYVVDGNITATSAELSTGNAAPLTVSASSATLSASGMVLGSSLNSSGTVTFNSSGIILDTGAVNVGSFILQNGFWSQYTSGGTLPSFSVTNDFELQNSSTFLRVAGGNGTSIPYLITDIYGLEGIGSPSHSQLGYNYVLGQNIDASGTATWNYSSGIYGGFVPIGGQGGNNPYTGTFNGGGFSINGLTINQPNGEFVGLFGYTYAGTVQNMALLGGSITGSTEVGSLVGLEGFGATLETSFSTANVSGFNSVGGLVGANEGTLQTSYSTGAVSVSTEGSYGGIINSFGGLVGANIGTVQTCYATGTVSGATEYAGGLVGYNGNTGTVGTSYSTGAVTGGSGSYNIGGLLGGNAGTVQSNYWLQDTGINTGLFGIGDASSNAEATPEGLAALKLQSTYTGFNFALGTGDWGINGYTSNGLINNGLPYFQWQYPTQAKITPNSQQFVYSGTTGTLDQTQYSVEYNPNNTVGENSLGTLLSAGPTFSIIGNNVNVVTSTPNTIGTSITVNPGYAVEEDTTATVTYAPKPITVTANSGQTIVYGTDTATGNASLTYTSSGLIGTDSLGGILGGYTLGNTVVGSPYGITIGSLSNSNYSITFTGANYSVVSGLAQTTSPASPVQPTSPMESNEPAPLIRAVEFLPTENKIAFSSSNFLSFQVAYKAPINAFFYQTDLGDSRYIASYLPKIGKPTGRRK